MCLLKGGDKSRGETVTIEAELSIKADSNLHHIQPYRTREEIGVKRQQVKRVHLLLECFFFQSHWLIVIEPSLIIICIYIYI